MSFFWGFASPHRHHCARRARYTMYTRVGGVGGCLGSLGPLGLDYTLLGSLGENRNLNFFRAPGNHQKKISKPVHGGQCLEKKYFLAIFMRTAEAGELVFFGAGGPSASAEERDDLLMRNANIKKPGAAITADVVRIIGEASFGLTVAVLR